MKQIYITIIIFSVIAGTAQNLVPNSSFESYTMCPYDNSQVGQIEFAVPWTAATATSSTDYWNACAGDGKDGLPGIPYNFGGFQYARTGNAFVGFGFSVSANSSATILREYLQAQLISPLVSGKIYYVEFFVNLHNANWVSPCNNIAANLSILKPYTNALYELQSLTPHIMNLGNPVINDTMNWVKVSGCYTAQGGEEYITIGNFFDNINTQTTGTTGVSYYFVDDVKVEEFVGTCVTSVNELGNNINIDVYPNPNSGTFSIAYAFENNTNTFTLVDVLGKVVLSKTLTGTVGIETITTQDVLSGIYFYHVTDNNGKQTHTGKLMINK